MTELKHCPKCGAPIPSDARWGICPKCLLEPGAQAPVDQAEPFSANFSEESRRFADYELVRQIGRGGMGVVYEAFHLSLRRTVAIKMILDAQVYSPAARRRFAIEAEAAAKLDHPNIVPIYEVGEHLNQPFLSMKLVQGDSLRSKISSGELCVADKSGNLRRSARYSRQQTVAQLMALVARAVHHAHQHGVLHRDLKPGNILIDQAGQPHLTDFGLAKILDQGEGDPASLTHATAIVGTPSYMSPEQASGRRLSPASDIYSLGVILYEMLVGRPPFRASTPLETIRLVTDQEARPPGSVDQPLDRDLDTICMKCLEKSPDARYGSALALAEDLERWLRKEPIRARPVGTVLRLGRWIKRNPVGAGLIASLCAGLIVALLLLQSAQEQKRHLDILAAIHGDEFMKEVQELWDQPDRSCVPLSSAKLAALDHRIPSPPDAQAVTLRWAISINEAPISQAMAFAPILAVLEERMKSLLGRRVLFDLRLYKARSWESPAVGRGDVEVQRVSALTYVRLTQEAPGAQPLARVRDQKDAVIFAGQKTGIARLEQVAGHRAAFAHTNAVVSFWAKVVLARAGICGTDLKSYENLLALDQRTGADQEGPTGGWGGEGDAEDFAHSIVIKKVLAGEFDVGVAPARRFEAHRGRRGGLVELARYAVPSTLYVTKPGLDPQIFQALQQSLVSLKGKRLLGRIGPLSVNGFEAVKDSDFNDVRQALTNELRCFETGAAASAVQKSAPGQVER